MAGKKASEYRKVGDHDFDQNSDAGGYSDHEECDCNECRAANYESDAPWNDPNCTECGPGLSKETELQTSDFLTAEEIEAVRSAYDLVGLDRIASLKNLKQAIRSALLEHHPDRTAGTSHAAESATKTTQLNEASKVVDSLLKSPQKYQQYRFFQHSSLVLISNHPQFAVEIIRYVTTFTTYENGRETKVSPSPAALKASHLIHQKLAAFVTLLMPAMQKLHNDFIPTVLKKEHDDKTVITAENYSVSELLALYKLIISGDYKLPYSLRYSKHKNRPEISRFSFIQVNRTFPPKEELHRLLTFAINLEMANLEYYDYAREEVSSVEFTRKMSEGLWLAAMISIISGAVFYYAALGMSLSILFTTYVPLALMVPIPVFLIAVSLIWGYFPVKNFNAFIANSSPMMKEYFFNNCGTSKIELNSEVFVNALSGVQSQLGNLTQENTSEKSFQEAEFTYGERAGNFAGSFFGPSTRSNKLERPVEQLEERSSISMGLIRKIEEID